MVSGVAMHDDGAPCFVFDEVPGTIEGSRVLVNFFGGKRKNMTLGFPTDLSKLELSEGFRTSFMGPMTRIPPKYVNDGPIFENVMTGDDIDVTRFPAPKWHAGDGGRYIGTGSFNVTRDPDEGWINCGTYRVMIHDAKTAGFYISPGKHGRQMRDKYQARGERMPVAVVCGGDPMTFLMACERGALRRQRVRGRRRHPRQAGRGRQWPGHRPADPGQCRDRHRGLRRARQRARRRPVRRVDRLLRQRPAARAGARHQGDLLSQRSDPARLRAAAAAGRDLPLSRRRPLRRCCARTSTKAGVPGVTAAWAHEVGNARLLLAVAVNQRYPGHAKQAGHIAAMCHVGAYCGRYVIVVDDDIDVSNLEEVMWALLTRSDPATSIDIIRNAWSTPLDPRIEPERKAAGDFTNSRAVIDACRPWHWRDQFPKVNTPTPGGAAGSRMSKFGHLFKS